MNRKRLDAESLKDTLLWHGGRVHRATGPDWGTSKRSLFAAPTRSAPDPLLSLFDGPDPHLVVPRRADSTSAPQALFMMNSPSVVSTAKAIVVSLARHQGDDAPVIGELYHRLMGRPPTAEERRLAMETLLASREIRRRLAGTEHTVASGDSGPWEDLCMALLCSNEFIYVD